MTVPDIPNFASLFQFDQRVSALETEMFEFKQTSQFADVVSLISGIVDNYLASRMKEAVDVDSTIKAIIKEQVQAQVSKIMPQIDKSDIQKDLYKALVESYNSDKHIISSYGDVVTLKRGRDDQDKDEDPSAGSIRESKRRRLRKEAESSKEPKHKESKSTSSSKSASRSQPKSLGKSAHTEEHDQKVVNLKDQTHQEFNIGDDDECQWNPSSSPTFDREWHKKKTVDKRPPRRWITQLAQAAGTQSLFNEFWLLPLTSLPS
nr:hypothetical protein [Tanacetum cinerariifolium]